MSTAFQPLVSVVTPVFNGARYLDECITSILNQTYQNWEYIIVNNCSTDQTQDIAEKYAKNDKRIRVHNNKTFVSAIQNHHIGFSQISPQSNYCKVVQADDWIFPECLSQMVHVAETHPSTGIVGAYRLDNIYVNLDGLPYPSTLVPGRTICRSSLLGGPYVFGSPTSLLLRSSILRDKPTFYDEEHFAAQADTAACYEVLKSWDFGFVHQVLTYTRRHQEAASSFARRMNSYFVGQLLILKHYGPVYLDHSEYEERLNERIHQYYKFLGRNLYKTRDSEFWSYHKDALNKLGYSFKTTDLIIASLQTALEKFSFLKKTHKNLSHLSMNIFKKSV